VRRTRPLRSRPWRRLAPALIALLLAGAVAGPASASPQTLRRSVGNILFAPLDLVLAPVVAFRSAYRNIRDVDDTPGVRVVWLVPGVIWSTGVQGGAALLREFAGLIEFVPGLGLVFFETDMDPMFDPSERGEALVDIETDPLWVKFGVSYID
jgi:hypothetical protein